jgi:hypothetical protein
MKLLDEIVDLAIDNQASISVLLRKCLVLAHQLKNDRLRSWVENELNGYAASDAELPEYRKVNTPAKGLFLGSFGRMLKDQPLQSSVMEPQHRHFATTARLRQPIISYEGTKDGSNGNYAIPWPQDLTVKYQQKFLKDSDFALNRAWQEIPASIFPAIIDTVRTRVLQFALELRDELGLVDNNVSALPQAKVDQSVTTYIFGGTNVIAGTAHGFTQIGAVNVEIGDIAGLTHALRNLGVPESDVAELKTALETDGEEIPADAEPTLGRRTAVWLKKLGSKLANAGTQIAVDTAKAEAMRLISQYLGLL